MLVSIAATILLAGQMISTAAAASPRIRGLSTAQLAAALGSMSEAERAGRLEHFSSSRWLVVGYSRIVATDAAPGAGAKLATVTSSNSVHGLTISVSVERDLEAPDYRWDITAYFDWTQWPANLGGEDSFAVAWNNNLAYIGNAYAWGKYTNGAYISPMYLSDQVPGIGQAVSFNEWKTVCPGRFCTNYYANYGWLIAVIAEPTFRNVYTNVMAKYFHTFKNLSYSVGFSASGPSVSITPVSDQWSLATSVTITT